MRLWGGGDGGDISIIHVCIIKLKSNIHKRNIITLHHTGNKFLQSGNKSLNHATVNHTVHYATLQDEVTTHYLSGNYSTIPDQDQILSRMYLFLLGLEIINLGPVALAA